AERQLVQPLAPISAHAAREDVRFPRSGGNFESGELFEHLGNTARAIEHRVFIDVLPARQVPEELASAGGLDLAAERVDGVTMDAGKQPALAPGGSTVQSRAQDGAVVLQLGQEGFLFATAQGDARIAFKDGPEGFEPAEEDFLRLAGGVDREPSALAVDHAILLRQLI